MATSKTFFGLRRGSTKSMTFQVLNGQQITKDRVYGGRNPRSDAQMTQRSQFLSAVRFYERSLRRFFKFAFESKKQTESEYNAFMRLNAKIGPYITKAQGDAVGFPMVAPWCISQGSLLTLPQAIIQDPDLGDEISLLLAKNWDGDGPYTIAQLSQLIRAAHPSVLEGDIITIVVIRGTEDGTAFVTDYDAANITSQNEWIVDQFIINSSDEREIGEVIAQANVSVVDSNLYLVGMVGDTTKIYAGAIVVSRNTAGGLVVSTNKLMLNSVASTAYNTMRDNAHREQVLAWWGAQQQAILQGSLATTGEEPAPGIVSVIAVDGVKAPRTESGLFYDLIGSFSYALTMSDLSAPVAENIQLDTELEITPVVNGNHLTFETDAEISEPVTIKASYNGITFLIMNCQPDE